MNIIKIIDNIEIYICRILLVMFVSLIFAQIVLRELFDYSMTWSEELAVYLFVWFVYFGASHAAKLSAHNRITFQYRWLPEKLKTACQILSDVAWVAFNGYIVYLSYDFLFRKANLFWKSQTLGIPMKYVYLVIPISFCFMIFRIIQINYLRHIKGVDIQDPESKEINDLMGAEPSDKKTV